MRKRLIAQSGRLSGADTAQLGACELSVESRIAGQLPCLGGKSDALGHSSAMVGRVPAQFFKFRRIQPAGVSTGEANTAPCVTLELLRKGRDRFRDGAHVSALHKPQAASQSLIKDMAAGFR